MHFGRRRKDKCPDTNHPQLSIRGLLIVSNAMGQKVQELLLLNSGKCHAREVKEFTGSHHADAGMIIGSVDNVLAKVVEGHTNFNKGANPSAASGCWQCHGSKVGLLLGEKGNKKFTEDGILQLDPKTWPNTGIGRVNFDGSKGSCSACTIDTISLLSR